MKSTAALLLVWLLTGCSANDVQLRPEGIVGRWEVFGNFSAIKQTFGKDGSFQSESKIEIPVENGGRIEPTLVLKGAYILDKDKLTTRLLDAEALNVDKERAENIVHNLKEVLNREVSGTLRWLSKDRFSVRQSDGTVLMYRRIK
jgi:hypothetical protein